MSHLLQKIFHNKPGMYHRISVLLYAALIVLGVFFIVDPDTHYRMLPYLLGIVMLFFGVDYCGHSVMTGEYRTLETADMARGILFFVVGVVILAQGASSYGLIGSAWGIYGLYHVVQHLNTAIYRIVNHKENALLPFVLSVIGTVLAILLLLDPAENVYHHMEFIGLELIFIGCDEGIEYLESQKK